MGNITSIEQKEVGFQHEWAGYSALITKTDSLFVSKFPIVSSDC